MRYAVIGAGLAGLAAAYRIADRAGEGAEVDVFEAADRVGGKALSVPFDHGPVDVGAESLLTRNEAANQLIEELGLKGSLVKPSARRSLIYSGDRLHQIPSGGLMGIPATGEGLAELIGTDAAAAIDNEPEAAGLEWEPGTDRSLGALIRERYGDGVADRIVSALLGGIYSCAADDLGVRATVPQLAAALDRQVEAGEDPSLARAVAAALEERAAGRAAATGVPSGSEESAKARPNPAEPNPDSPFVTFAGGYQELYETLAEKAAERGAKIYIDAFVAELKKKGSGWAFKGGEGTYDRVVLATPAPTSALLLRDAAPRAAAQLSRIKLASSAVVGLRLASGEGLPKNSGILVAADQPGVAAKAFTFASNKWPHLATRPGFLLRASFGRFGDDALVRAEEDELVDRALDDLETITGVDARELGVEEIFTQRWFGGIPRYDEHHGKAVAEAAAALADAPGIEATGAWANGVGVPAVLADALAAADRALG